MYNTRQSLLLKICQQHDDESWETFADLYRNYIYVIIRRMNISHEDCQDLSQDILLQLWNKLPEFSYEPNKAKFRTWLCRVVRNHALNFIKASSRRHEKKEMAAGEVDSTDQSEIDTMMQKEWEIYLTNLAMARLRDKFNGQAIEAFELSLKGESIAAIAQKLKLQEQSVYKLKSRVKDRLISEIKQLRHDME